MFDAEQFQRHGGNYIWVTIARYTKVKASLGGKHLCVCVVRLYVAFWLFFDSPLNLSMLTN